MTKTKRECKERAHKRKTPIKSRQRRVPADAALFLAKKHIMYSINVADRLVSSTKSVCANPEQRILCSRMLNWFYWYRRSFLPKPKVV
jgi:hypothetical protein